MKKLESKATELSDGFIADAHGLLVSARIGVAATVFSLASIGSGGAQIAAPQSARPSIVHVSPNQTAERLLRYPDNTLLELPNGSRATVAQLRKLSQERRLERESMLGYISPESVTIHFNGGDASRSRYESALLAASKTTSPAAVCRNGRSGIGLVNGKPSGIAFAPGGSYRIVGCGFGSSGALAITGGSAGGSFALAPSKWSDSQIDATMPASITAVPDQENVTLTVTATGGLPLEQAGHSFVAARESVMIRKLDTSYRTSSEGPYEPALIGTSIAGVTNGDVTFLKVFMGHVQLEAKLADVFSTASMPLAPGFGVENIAVTNTTSQMTMDNDDVREALSAPFAVSAADSNGVEIRYQLNCTYRKQPSAIMKGMMGLVQGPLAFFAALRGGESACSGGYDVAVTVTGPRGMPPLRQ